jgi:hypothetical protein
MTWDRHTCGLQSQTQKQRETRAIEKERKRESGNRREHAEALRSRNSSPTLKVNAQCSAICVLITAIYLQYALST